MAAPPLTISAWLRYAPILELLYPLDDVERLLEVGAGEGAMGARLARRFAYVGLEPDARSFAHASPRIHAAGGTILQGTDSVLDDDARFDVVCAFEVLEHIEDDQAALDQWRARIRPGGWLLLSVPAHSRRFGSGDVKAGHFRRYEREQMHDLLASTGFVEPVIWSYAFPLGYALELVRNTIGRRADRSAPIDERTAESGRWLQPPAGLGWLTAAVTAPFRLIQRPFVRTELGIGFVVRARRS